MKIIHVWCQFGEVDAETRRRNTVAQGSWDVLGLRDVLEVTSAMIHRDGRSIDPAYPAWFATDIIDAAHLRKASDDDIILLTSADSGFMPGAMGEIIDAVRASGSVHLRRRNFQRIDVPITDHDYVKTGGDYPGMDGCAFTAAWWVQHRKIFCDVLYGRQHWDGAMRNLIRWSGGTKLMDQEWHEEHPAFWWSGKTNKANLYNERLLCTWIANHGGSTLDYLYEDGEIGYQ